MEIFWININKLNYKNFLAEITKFEKQNIVFTPNPEILLKTKENSDFKNLIKKASYLTPDWIWLYLGFQIIESNSKIIAILLLPYFLFNLIFRKNYLYKKYWDRICGSDLTKDILNICEEKNIKFTIIDLYKPTDKNKVESQKTFSQDLKNKYKNIIFDYFIYNPEKKEEIIKKINKSDSKILFSTLWMKLQEESVIEIMEKCNNIKLWLWIWSSFDYIIWFQKRAPKIWRTLWIEWLYRLIRWPQKINRIKRLYNAIFIFSFEVFKSK
jgi:N-acetylglucosaminyldiphosphoundecaprenol N-acetyl-beta-D-mannosaminyltransferase